MIPQPPIPEPLWNTVPPEAQAAILAVLESLQGRIADLEPRSRDLEARLKLNSTNSSKPPSSDPIGLKRKPPAPPSGRKRGGQPGHRQGVAAPWSRPRRSARPPTAGPRSCRRCGHALHGDDPTPLVHQVAELPKIEPIVDEYRLHRLACPGCGATTCGDPARGGPRPAASARTLQAVLATLAGAYRLSKRQIQQLAGDLFGLSISTGMISKLERQSAAVLEAPYNELAVAVHDAEAANIDETSWREDRRKAWLWVAVTALTTVFTIAAQPLRRRWPRRSWGASRTRSSAATGSARTSGSARLAAGLLEAPPPRFPGDDRPGRRRGGDRPAVVAAVEADVPLVAPPRATGRMDWGRFRRAMARLRREVKPALEDGSRCGCAKTAATCFEILKVEEGLWTFVRVEGVEPTNNAAERAVRHAVIWRRISGGTDSAEGSRFVERMLTVVATCRQQGRNVLDYLTSCFEADRKGQAIPSLLPVTEPAIKVA